MGDARERRHADTVASNTALEGVLKEKGVGITNIGIVSLQLEALKRVVLTEDTTLDYKLHYQELVAEQLRTLEEQLEEIEKTRRMEALLDGVTPTVPQNGHAGG